MVYIKTILRKRKDGSTRRHYYLAENYREAGTIKTRILKPLSAQEATHLQRIHNKAKATRQINNQVEDPGRAHDQDDTSKETVRKLSVLIAQIYNKEPPFKKAYRPQKFAELFLEPILQGPQEET